jgi:hypothetical protein
MNERAKIKAKVQKPCTHFDEPHEVVANFSQSKAHKVAALDRLERAARLDASLPVALEVSANG